MNRAFKRHTTSITPTVTKDVVNTQVADVMPAKAATVPLDNVAATIASPVLAVADNNGIEDEQEAEAPKDNSIQASLAIPQDPVTEADVEVMDPDVIPDRINAEEEEHAGNDDGMLIQMNRYIDDMKEKSYLTWCYLKNEADMSINGKYITILVNSVYLQNEVKLIMNTVMERMEKYYEQEFVLNVHVQHADEPQQMIDRSNPDEIYKYMVEKNHKINDFKIMLNLNIEY